MSAEELYPAGPNTVPADLTQPTRAYKRHAWLAMLGLIGFVALYVFLCFWFARSAYRNLTGALAGSDKAFFGFVVGAVAAILAVFLIKALFAVTKGKTDQELEVTVETEPALFRFLHRLADETGAPRPHRVFLSPRVNAAVFYDLSFLNLLVPSKKNLEIGLGLVNVLTLSDLKAVLAHEFGHFAQRSMAVGRWVYVAQQIAGHIVARRDWFDRGLQFLSSIDIRVAWIGWLLRLIVWSIRAILDSAFSLVVLAQRALSREMEFQADLVAVSVTGSDALVHALHRLGAADHALDRALVIASTEHAKGRQVPDLFAIQTRVSDHMRVILDDPHHASPPRLPDRDRAAHRIFEEGLAQAPRMWSTHPSNREREDNTKRIYIEAPLDDRPAWLLFRDPEGLRREVTAKVLSEVSEERPATPATLEEALSAVDKRFASPALDRRYRGAYLGRSTVLRAQKAADLRGPAPDPSSIRQELDALYPPSLSARLENLRKLEEELASLEALRDGFLTAPGGVIRHRGRTLKKKELPDAIHAVRREVDVARRDVDGHDRQCRTLHQAAALALGRGWPQFHAGLLSLLHYAGHAEADVDDARGHLANVFSIVIADGRVSAEERARLVRAAGELYYAMMEVQQRRDHVLLPQAVQAKLEVASWAEILPKSLQLNAPTAENIGDWMNVVDSWHQGYSGPLSALERTTLETLLEAEAHIAACFRHGTDPGTAPEPARVPDSYTTRVAGTERERQRRLGLWDRFATADGLGPALGRFVVAGAIVGSVLGFSGSVGEATIVVYNGLGDTVKVEVGDSKMELWPGQHSSLDVAPSPNLRIRAFSRRGKEIESLEGDASNGLMTYVYNVAGAGALVEWTAVYGDRSEKPERPLGGVRFQQTTADVLFEDPPKSVSTKSGGAERTVLSAVEGLAPAMLGRIESESERNRLIETHARWDSADSAEIQTWLVLASGLPSFGAIAAQRLRDDAHEIVTLRAEQDAARGGSKAEVCARHKSLAAAEPASADLAYIAARCTDDEAERDRNMLAAYATHPKNPWIANAAGFTLAEQGKWHESVAALFTAATAVPLRAQAALTLERIMRLNPHEGPLPAELLHNSPALERLQELETGAGVPPGPYQAYSALARGDLEAALNSATHEPSVRARVLRLAAASDGAQPDLIQQALALGNNEGLDQDTVWASLALRAREQQRDPATTAAAKEAADKHATLMLRLIDDPKVFDDSVALEKLLDDLPLTLRAQACVMAVILKGQTAPKGFRKHARALLFSPERPYFAADPGDP